ncbi:MAG: amphi-Trp domain-containing protein [Natronomonas sp.]|jgi:amphi-Trp domain-containing protein|uniref:Amphi-Trp domain-containing protein n=1 Tax=Natronomonas salsuginis TaxID=2217661 RepID=A0A4U5JIH7_9EURY|nr:MULTISPECIES: amphi-Trp domain-containing protein [Natronomonas]MDR9429693.1 amphi-Trp domain-containing protein [Natronomonas sp.]TKR27527.1 amphi-Trp domain-containing protein [Natronomonas salsuginis]
MSDTPDTTEEPESPEVDTDRTVIREGRNFETEYRLDAREAGEFLIRLGEQLRDGDELRLVTDEWELPFAFGEPIELEIDFEGVDEPELEIELELPGRTDETAPDVR